MKDFEKEYLTLRKGCFPFDDEEEMEDEDELDVEAQDEDIAYYNNGPDDD
jgi:hypothetical protein